MAPTLTVEIYKMGGTSQGPNRTMVEWVDFGDTR